MKQVTCSLIIATYNWVESLELVLLSVKNQSVIPNEVIIADDGSTKETKELIEHFRKDFPTKLIHVWHKDDGFRLAKIRNKAICKAISDYIIQIDGDVILHQHFVKNHLENAEKNCFLTGSRVLMKELLTLKNQNSKNIKFNYLSKGIKNRFNAVYFPFLTRFLKKTTRNLQKATKVRGCNMSFWRKHLIEVNGYNEEMTGWGREDSELSARLVNSGKAKQRIKFGAIQYHQFHREKSKDRLDVNDEILKNTIEQKIVRCDKGISQYC